MSLNKLSLNKMADALVKAMEQKEHFDKKGKQKEYIQKISILKEVLTQEYKFAIQRNSKDKPVIEKHISYIKKIQNRESIDTSDQQIIDQLLSKYS